MSDVTTIRDRERFVVPRPPSHVVARLRLDDRYRVATGRILRVLAPPGYGKTTLVRRWVAQDDRVIRWLDLERVDNDPAVLMAAFARGLSDLVDDPACLVPEFSPRDRRFIDVAIPAFGAAIGRIVEPFVIVIDDSHHVTDDTAWILLDCLARNVPEESTVVFVGRGATHGSSLSAMRLEPGIVDVATGDLALDVVETEQLLVAHGVELGLDEVVDLADLFEGWPAGLRLASLVLASTDGQQLLEPSATGQLTYVTDYLRSEWLVALSAADRQFLMEVACLRSFNADMCDQVLDRAGSAAVIQRLEHRHVIVTPLDRRGDWYRMHGLLRDWLETELRQADRARWLEVHCDAARWWERAGDIDLAVQHLEQAENTARRHDLVVTHAAPYIMRGLFPTVRRWLSGFSADEIRASPGLCVATAGVELAGGDGPSALRWAQLFGSASLHPTANADSTLTLWADILWSSIEAGPALPLLDRAERARSSIETGPWHVYGSLTVGLLRAMTGAPDAIDIFLDGAHEAGIVGVHSQQVMCLAFAAILLDIEGDRDAATAHADAAARIIRELGLDHALAATAAAAARSVALARAGRRSEALGCLERCRAALPGLAEIAPAYNVLTRLAMVRAALMVDDPTRASKLLREIDHHLRFEPAQDGLRDHVAGLRAQVAARGVSAESWSLTAAELRVLQHLPTNLSLAEIATELFISRNTVKSHTAAIYRKLGTTARSRAVELARVAGLLTDTPPPS